jgi:DNA-binding beta-propeller fold protein YncE
MMRPPLLLRSITILFAALLLAHISRARDPSWEVAFVFWGPPSGSDPEVPFKFRGRTWTAVFSSSSHGSVTHVLSPGDAKIKLENAPFLLKENGDQVEVWSKGPVTPRSRSATTEAKFVYLIEDSIPNQRILIFNQEPPGLETSIAIPARPAGLALTRDARRLYVSHRAVEPNHPVFPASPPRISVINTAVRNVGATINLPQEIVPAGIDLSPDGRILYLANEGTFTLGPGHQGASLVLLDTETQALTGQIALPQGSTIRRLATTPDGALVYGASIDSFPARVFVLDTATRTQAGLITPPASVRDILLDRTGTRLYVLTAATLIVYDTATNLEEARIPLPANARLNSLALSIDGGSLFVNDQNSTRLIRIDTATDRIAEEIPVLDSVPPFSIMFVTH